MVCRFLLLLCSFLVLWFVMVVLRIFSTELLREDARNDVDLLLTRNVLKAENDFSITLGDG